MNAKPHGPRLLVGMVQNPDGSYTIEIAVPVQVAAGIVGQLAAEVAARRALELAPGGAPKIEIARNVPPL